MIEEPEFTSEEKAEDQMIGQWVQELKLHAGEINGRDLRAIARYCMERESAQEKRIEQEHENYLSAHRDNMKAVERIVELKADLERMRRELRISNQEFLRMQENFDRAMLAIEQYRAEISQSEAREAELSNRIENALNEIGVPQPGYPQPVANAYEILKFGKITFGKLADDQGAG